MRRALLAGVLVAALAAVMVVASGTGASADTGTYTIVRYSIEIDPQPDGSWIADYLQEWTVTGGHIPWVTVGLPHSRYDIVSQSGAAASVRRADEGSWSGVRVDLDRDYLPGESFSFGFRVRQERMGYRKGDAVQFSFVPGWYDNAETHRLEVRVHNPGSAGDLLLASPEPSETTAGGIVWVTRLGRGERFRASFALSPALFPDLAASQGPATSGEGAYAAGESAGAVIFGIIVVLVVLALILSIAARAGRGGYRGRRGVFYGGPVIIPPVARPSTSSGRPGRAGGGAGGSRKSGGGGGFGGRAIGCACVACACACVSCACACACAGGGGAGCARKFGFRPRDAREARRPAPSGRVVTLLRLVAAVALTAIALAAIALAAAGCGAREQGTGAAYDENVEVPAGDPAFPRLGRYWVVDPDGLVGAAAAEAADDTLEALRAQGIAETVIVVQRGVRHPVEWSTHYGRWLRLGDREGPRRNNGLVFLVIPDASPESGRVWYSIGRGLPRLTSSDMGPLLEEAAAYANADDLDGAVVSIARNIDDILRRIYGEGER